MFRAMKLSILHKNEAILVTISCIFMGFFASGVLQMIITRTTSSPVWGNVGLIFGEAAMLLPLLYIMRRRQQRLRTFIPRKRISPSLYIVVIIFGLGTLMVLDGIGALLDQLFTIPDWLQKMEQNILWQSTPELILLVIAGVIIAPVVEEFIFRGVLQQALAGHYQHLLPAVVAPAVMFTIFHVQYLMYPPAAIELLLLALAFGWAMGKTGNILAPILLHGLNNLISLIWLGTNINTPGFVNLEQPDTWGWFFLGLVLMGLAGWRLNKEPDFIPFAIAVETPSRFTDNG